MWSSIYKYKYFLVWWLVLLGVGALLGQITAPQIQSWYSQLVLPPYNPPNEIFAPVWTILYSLLAYVGFWLWQQSSSVPLRHLKTLYLLQLLMNWSWTPIFFYWHALGLASLWLIILIMIVLVMMRISLNYSRKLFWILLPYLLWLIFACYLNLYIFSANHG